MDPISLLLVGASGLLAYAGFASERSQRKERFGGAPRAPRGKMIDHARVAVQKLIQNAQPKAIKGLEQLDADVNRAVKTTVQQAPFRMFDLISNAAFEGAGVLAKEVPSEARDLLKIQAEIKTIRTNTAQRKNLATVERALGSLKGALSKNPQLAAMTDAIAQRLELDNLLGLGPTRNAVMILGALGAGIDIGKRALAGEKFNIATPHGTIALSKNLDYAASLNIKAPQLTRNSMKIVLEGKGLTNVPTVKAIQVARGRSRLGVSGSTQSGRAELGLPFARQGTFSAGVSGGFKSSIPTPGTYTPSSADQARLRAGLPVAPTRIAAGVRGFDAQIGMQTIPERGQLRVGVQGTPHTPLQSATLAAPTKLRPGRHGRAATIAPRVAVDPRRGGKRSAGIQLNIPI